MDAGQFAHDLQQLIYDASRILLWPVLIAAIVCLVWVLIELGVLLYELWLRIPLPRPRRPRGPRAAGAQGVPDGKPRTAYRYLQENNYSLVVVRFLYDLIRNYQTERLAAKPLKLLQEYEFYTIKRLERTRILVRIGPMLGLMGTLIPLSPALVGLASGNTQQLVRQPRHGLLGHRHRPPHRRPRVRGQHRARPHVLAGHLRHGVPAGAARGLRRPAALRAPALQDRRLGHRGRSSTRSRRRTPSARWSTPPARRRTSRLLPVAARRGRGGDDGEEPAEQGAIRRRRRARGGRGDTRRRRRAPASHSTTRAWRLGRRR